MNFHVCFLYITGNFEHALCLILIISVYILIHQRNFEARLHDMLLEFHLLDFEWAIMPNESYNRK